MTQPPLSPAAKRARRALRAQRGFTLIELLVALTGGLFVSIAVFVLARDASRFYQREGRLASATLNAVVGFERLRADLARAGFLVSPNVQRDPLVCSRPPQGGPSLLANLASIQVSDGSKGATPSPLAENNRYPDALLLAGSYSSTDEFVMRSVASSGSGYEIVLGTETGAMARLGWAALQAEGKKDEGQRRLSDIFAIGRGLRIVDLEGRQHYGVIAGVTVDATLSQPTILLDGSVPLHFRDQDQSKLCGFNGPQTGAPVSVINFVRYQVKNLSASNNKNYAALFASSKNTAIATYENQRTELVRTELKANGDEMTQVVDGEAVARAELVAEYAVDLQFDVTAAIGARGSLTVQYFKGARGETAADADFATYTGPALTDSNQPERARSLRAMLMVRSREPDREAPGPVGYRIGLGADGKMPYARTRTLQAEVALTNNVNAEW